MLFQVRAASDRYISGCYDDAEVDAGEDDSDVICLDEEDAAESERRKLAMSPRAPATKDEAPAKTKDSEKEDIESSEEGGENGSSEE